MFNHLHIPESRERWLVGCMDLALAPFSGIRHLRRGSRSSKLPTRVVLFRLERIGDLLMSLSALRALRARVPQAYIQLVVGSWNASLSERLTEIDQVETLDAPWLSREGTSSSLRKIATTTAGWRKQEFDLAINFEPDIRTNALVASSGAVRRVGWSTGGGGAFLTDALQYDRKRHAATNAIRLVDHALPSQSLTPITYREAQLQIPETIATAVDKWLDKHDECKPLVGINPGCGRMIKQWPCERFSKTAAMLFALEGATIVLLGSESERQLTDAVKQGLPAEAPVIDLVGLSLVELAAVLKRLSVVIVGDTGPMHLASAVGTPSVAIFGPSDPTRYSPLHQDAVVVHADLWCRPCGRIRHPPVRCCNRTPDCLTAVSVDTVVCQTRQILSCSTVGQ